MLQLGRSLAQCEISPATLQLHSRRQAKRARAWHGMHGLRCCELFSQAFYFNRSVDLQARRRMSPCGLSPETELLMLTNSKQKIRGKTAEKALAASLYMDLAFWDPELSLAGCPSAAYGHEDNTRVWDHKKICVMSRITCTRERKGISSGFPSKTCQALLLSLKRRSSWLQYLAMMTASGCLALRIFLCVSSRCATGHSAPKPTTCTLGRTWCLLHHPHPPSLWIWSMLFAQTNRNWFVPSWKLVRPNLS